MKPVTLFLAAGLLLLSAQAARSGDNGFSRVVEYDEETIYYPAGWKHDRAPNGRGPESGIDIYHNYVWFDRKRPIGSGDWATIHITRWNCDGCIHGAHAGTLTDFLKDKDCAAPKCAYEQSKCPVHTAKLVPRWRITNKCALIDRFPKLIGGVCGNRYAKKTYKKTVY